MSIKDYRNDLPYQDDYLLPGDLVYLDDIHKLYCERFGKGPVILVIPGLTGDAGEFSHLIALLAREFSVVSFDRRGYSRSPRGWTKSSVDEQAQDVSGLINTLGLESVFLITSSVGVNIAMKWIMRFPKQVRGAIFHEPWIPAFLENPKALGPALEAGEKAVQVERARRNNGTFEARLRFLMGRSGFENLPSDVRNRVFKNHEMFSVEDLYYSSWVPPNPVFFPPFPITLTVGRESPPFLKEMTRRMESVMNLKTMEVPGMHGAYMDHPIEFHSMIRPILNSWLAESGRSLV
jgi:pimeloyl-ACP methyl ester carboxylesterase